MLDLCFVLFLVCVMSACANVYFKTICECIRWSIFICPRSIAGVPFDSVRRFRATLLLCTSCMRFWGNWVVACSTGISSKPVAAIHSAARNLGATRYKATIFWNLDSYSLVWMDRIVRLEMYKTWFSDLIKLRVKFIYNLASAQQDLVLSKKGE